MNVNALNDLGISQAGVTLFLTFMVIYSIIVSVIALVLYFLQAVGIYNMSVSSGFEKPWLSFIPFANSYALGRIAEKYRKRDGSDSAKFRIILPVLQVITFVVGIAMVIFSISAVVQIVINADSALQNDTEMTISMFSSLVPVIVFYLILMIAAITYLVFEYIVLWRVFSCFDYKNATLYTVLSVFFSFLPPIFLFAIRKKNPTFEYSERMGMYTNNY